MEKEIKKEEVKKEEKENIEVNEVSDTEFDEMFVVDPFEAERAREESGEEREGNTVIFKTPFQVVKHTTRSKTDGKEYSNYRVAWKRPLFGKDVLYELNLIPSDKRKVLYQMLEAMFGTGNKLPLDISKTVSTTTTNGKTTTRTTYSPRVSVVDEKGVEIVCPLRSAGAADRAVFDVLLALLKDKGIIS